MISLISRARLVNSNARVRAGIAARRRRYRMRHSRGTVRYLDSFAPQRDTRWRR